MKWLFKEPSVEGVCLTACVLFITIGVVAGIYLLGARFFIIIGTLILFVLVFLALANIIDRFFAPPKGRRR